MRPARPLLVAAALAAASLPAAAFAWTALNRLDVRPLPGPADFEVIESRGAGPREIWCAAADYARRVLDAPPAADIHVLAPRGPSATRPGAAAVGFTLLPGPELPPGPQPGDGGNYSIRLDAPGYALSVSHARSFCLDLFEFEEWERPKP